MRVYLLRNLCFTYQSNSEYTCFYLQKALIFELNFVTWLILFFLFHLLIFHMIPYLLAYHSLDPPSTYTMPSNLKFITLTFFEHLKVYFRKIIPIAPDDFLYFKLRFKVSFIHLQRYYLHFLVHCLLFKSAEADFLCLLSFFKFNHCHCFGN